MGLFSNIFNGKKGEEVQPIISSITGLPMLPTEIKEGADHMCTSTKNLFKQELLNILAECTTEKPQIEGVDITQVAKEILDMLKRLETNKKIKLFSEHISGGSYITVGQLEDVTKDILKNLTHLFISKNSIEQFSYDSNFITSYKNLHRLAYKLQYEILENYRSVRNEMRSPTIEDNQDGTITIG